MIMLDRWVEATLEWEDNKGRTDFFGWYSWPVTRHAGHATSETWPVEFILWTLAGPVSYTWVPQGQVNGKQGASIS